MSWWLQFAALTLLFVAWTGVGVEELVFGAIAAALAATANRRIAVPRAARFRLVGFLRFIPYFLRISLLGGVDVARRAFLPSMPIEPGFLKFPLRLDPPGPGAAFFAAVISLIPGTLCVEHEGGQSVLVHVIDLQAPVNEELQRLEEKVAAIFGELQHEADKP